MDPFLFLFSICELSLSPPMVLIGLILILIYTVCIYYTSEAHGTFTSLVVSISTVASSEKCNYEWYGNHQKSTEWSTFLFVCSNLRQLHKSYCTIIYEALTFIRFKFKNLQNRISFTYFDGFGKLDKL